MSQEDLIPFNQRPKGEHLLLAQKGGQRKGIVKEEAQKLRRIKERLAKEFPNPKDVEWLLQKLNDRPSMAADLLVTLEKLKKDGVHPSQRIAFANTEAQSLKIIHGERIKTENVNININTTIEEWESRLSNLLEDDGEQDKKRDFIPGSGEE